MEKQFHALFSGFVQGVGFRYTAVRIAQKFPVTGFVKNLPHGHVEVVAEGEEKSLHEFLAALREAFHSYIRKTDVKWDKASGQFRDFKVEF